MMSLRNGIPCQPNGDPARFCRIRRSSIRAFTRLALLWIVIASLGPGPSRAAAAEAAATKTERSGGVESPAYRIYPLRNGVCRLAGNHAFYGGNNAETYDYALYFWLILGGDKPVLVDAGLSDVAEMNRGAAQVLRQPITQKSGETSRAQLRKFGLTPADIGHVLITHLHFDHVDDLLLYTNAQVYIGKKEWEGALNAAATWGHGRILHEFSNNPQCQRRLVLLEDQEVLPGIESFWIGGHTPGSMAYRVNTAYGKAVLTGDTVSLLANFECNVPPGVFTSLDECRAALQKIRAQADVVLPSHDPGTVERWPPGPPQTPKYTIRALKVGQCEVRDYITFQDSQSQQTSTYFLYLWVIEGGPRPIVVETGPKYPDEFSRSTAQYIPGGIKQLPAERTVAALKSHGIEPATVSHVIATHLHADHYDYFDAFPQARLVVNRREYEANSGPSSGGKDRLAPDVRKALNARPEALQLVEDEEIAPGVRVFPLGCHTAGSQGVLVRTHLGPAILTGDVVYKYENLERDRPGRSPDEGACREALAKIRALADIVLPAHDPQTLERWPDGIIGGPADSQPGAR
jgi:glyoxylase-like metal-dependent hydrolase (beta-lactamase superfamily II)